MFTEIQIHFGEPIKSLDYFFYYDDNADKVISIDLSYFNSSLVKDNQYMYGGCSSLEEINFKILIHQMLLVWEEYLLIV